jgi:gluconolactonase
MSEPILRTDDFTTLVAGLDHPEGVAWGPDGSVYAGGEAGQVYRIGLDGTCTQIATTGGFLLGLCLDADSSVYACDQGRRAIMKIGQDGSVSTYTTGAPGRPLTVPNYPVFDHRGNLYVSDSGGWHQDDGCLYRIRPTGEAGVVSEELRQFPNGMALGPGGTELYVVLSTDSSVVAVALGDEGRVGPPRLVVRIPRTVPDGLAFDVQGNLYISCYAPSAIYRLSPAGELALLVEDWESTMIAAPTNIAFCGADLSTLVVATVSRWHLARATMPTAGQPLAYPHLR